MGALTLTPEEQKLSDLLLDVSAYIDQEREGLPPLELRFAGGWVRDKCLGKQSQDVDIAINLLTGTSFAAQLKSYLDDPKNLEKHGLEPKDVKNVHTIKANPDKSKHLETVTTKIFNLDVDLVNLRKETYTEDSRNPEVEFGTAKEDAVRRDATINALFYNIHTRQIEDLTGGLEDLQNKIIKTPLDPEKTFTDDPLRILRLIRFSSRYSFAIEPNTKKGMSSKDVLHAFDHKITRERVGVEVGKMLKEKVNNPNGPVQALKMIDKLGLFNTVFVDPTVDKASIPSTTQWKYAYECMAALESDSIYNVLVLSEDDRYMAWLLAALAPWFSYPIDVKKPMEYGIKLDGKLRKLVLAAFTNYPHVAEFKAEVVSGVEKERSTFGLAMRKWEGNWRLNTLLAILVQAMNSQPSDFAKIFKEWKTFLDYLQKLDLLNVCDIKPLIDGKILMKELNRKGGPWTKVVLEACIGLQLKFEAEGVAQEAMRDLIIDEIKKNHAP